MLYEHVGGNSRIQDLLSQGLSWERAAIVVRDLYRGVTHPHLRHVQADTAERRQSLMEVQTETAEEQLKSTPCRPSDAVLAMRSQLCVVRTAQMVETDHAGPAWEAMSCCADSGLWALLYAMACMPPLHRTTVVTHWQELSSYLGQQLRFVSSRVDTANTDDVHTNAVRAYCAFVSFTCDAVHAMTDSTDYSMQLSWSADLQAKWTATLDNIRRLTGLPHRERGACALTFWPQLIAGAPQSHGLAVDALREQWQALRVRALALFQLTEGWSFSFGVVTCL
jgi:hypothetical protein